MAYGYSNKFYLSGVALLVVLCNVSGVLSALYPTQPVAKTVYASGSSALVTWVDDGHAPRVSELGALTIKLYTAQAEYVATLAQGVNPMSYGTLVTIPTDMRNDTLYFLMFRAHGLRSSVYTANFAIVSDPILAKSPSPTSGDSAIPPLQSLLAANTKNNTNPSVATTMITQTQGQQTQKDMIPASTVTADPLNQGGSPYRNNGAAHSRAGQLEQARFRLLFIVWPAMFGLSMAL